MHVAALLLVTLATAAAEPRPIVVISDLHLGEGRDATQQWDSFEDFRWAEEFEAFLAFLGRAAPDGVDLVIAGDAFELWQANDGLCPILANKNLGCSEPDALARLLRVLGNHEREIAALRAFAHPPRKNTIHFLPGNHDAALLFPSVNAALLGALAGASAKFHAKGYWVSGAGSVLIEHGHMIGQDPNRFEGWPTPFLSGRLWRPWGEQFVVAYFNPWERKYPIIDNLTEELAGAKLAMAAEAPAHSPVEMTAELLRFFFFDVSWEQFKQGLGGAKAPVWDIETLRAGGDEALAALVPPEDPLHEMLRQGRVPGAMTAFDGRTDELSALCDKALASRKARAAEGSVVQLPCPVVGGGLGGGGGLGAVSEKIFGSRDRTVAERLRELQKDLGLDDRHAFVTYVYGHTHNATGPFAPLRSDDWNPVVINDGAWQRVVTPRKLHEREPDPLKALRLTPEDLPPCYSYVWIEPGLERTPQLRAWRKKDGVWTSGPLADCDNLPMNPK